MATVGAVTDTVAYTLSLSRHEALTVLVLLDNGSEDSRKVRQANADWIYDLICDLEVLTEDA